MFDRDTSDPLRVRRHVALACLVINMGIIIALIVAVFHGPPDRGTVISAASQLLLAISAGTMGFVGAWFHASFKGDKDER